MTTEQTGHDVAYWGLTPTQAYAHYRRVSDYHAARAITHADDAIRAAEKAQRAALVGLIATLVALTALIAGALT